MSRPDVGFVLNNKWFYPKNQDLLERIADVMGQDVVGRMLDVNAVSSSTGGLRLSGFISEATLRRASSVDQYLFVNGRPVKDKVLVGALRAAYMDVMHAREFPLCALYLTLDSRCVDVNVSPAKTEVHFLEPNHVRAFIIKNLRERLSRTMNENVSAYNIKESSVAKPAGAAVQMPMSVKQNLSEIFIVPSVAGNAVRETVPMNFGIRSDVFKISSPTVCDKEKSVSDNDVQIDKNPDNYIDDLPLGRVIGQVANKYILAQKGDCLVVVDQHAAHERITYEKLRLRSIKVQPLLSPIVIKLRSEDVDAVLTITDEMKQSGLVIDAFGDDAVAIFEKPADWDLNWVELFRAIAQEVRAYGHSSQLNEKLHLKLANYACHNSVRAGQKLDYNQMNMLLRDIENTNRGGECNHGRPVYKFVPISEIDTWFER